VLARGVKWWEAPNHFRSLYRYFQSQGQRGVHRRRMSKQTMTGLLPVCIRLNSLTVVVCTVMDASAKHSTRRTPNAFRHYAVTDWFCVIWSADRMSDIFSDSVQRVMFCPHKQTLIKSDVGPVPIRHAGCLWKWRVWNATKRLCICIFRLYACIYVLFMHIYYVHLCMYLCSLCRYVCVCVCETLEFHTIKFAFLGQLLEFLGFDKIHRH
jgi:hypothetical protein